MKIKNVSVVFLLSILFVFSGCNGGSEDAVEVSKSGYYNEVLDNFLSGEVAVKDLDYYQFRLSFLENNMDFDYVLSERFPFLENAYQYTINNDCSSAISSMKTWLDYDYTDLEVHLNIVSCYEDLGLSDEANFHTAIAEGLIGSIIDGLDGESEATAYEVFTPWEQIALLEYLGYERFSSEIVVSEDGIHVYELVNIKTEDGIEKAIYFDVTKADKKISESTD